MALPSSPDSDHSSAAAAASSKRLTLSFIMSMSSLMALLAKRAGRVSIKLKKLSFKHNGGGNGDGEWSLKSSAKSPMIRSKQLLTQISNKAITLIQSKKRERRRRNGVVGADEFGDGGVWQKAILMGDKCQPLDFSGVIYYDSDGKQLNGIPLRSPRASPLPGYLSNSPSPEYLSSGELKLPEYYLSSGELKY